MKPSRLSSALGALVCGLGCSDGGPPVPGEPAEAVAFSREAVHASVAANLAYPEYDLNEPTDYWWLNSASASEIRAKMNQGYRLHDIGVVSSSPLLFSATFVANTGVYARTGNDWDEDMTESELLAIYGDSTRRIVDIARYQSGGQTHYAAVWLSNTGSQQRNYKLVLNEIQPDFEAEASGFRVISVDSSGFSSCTPGTVCVSFPILSGVMIDNTGDDQREQWLGRALKGIDIATIMNTANGNCGGTVHCRRLATVAPLGADSYYYVMEELQTIVSNTLWTPLSTNLSNVLNVGELSWWAPDMFHDPGNRDRSDTIEHLIARTGGRISRLIPYATTAGTRYFAMAQGNGTPVPHGASSSNNGSNLVLNSVDTFVERSMRRAGIPGLTLAISYQGRLVHAKGYGYSDLQNLRVTEPTDLFRYASVSKSLTRAAIVRLANANLPTKTGTFSLDTKPWGEIWDYTKPATSPNLGDLTVRDLLNHTTRLRYVSPQFCNCTVGSTPGCDARDSEAACNPFDNQFTHQAWIDMESELGAAKTFYIHDASNAPGMPCFTTPTTPLYCNPVEEYRNAHYVMLGLIVEELTQRPFDEYLRATFLDPLNLDRVRVGRWQQGSAGCSLPPFPANLFQAVNYTTPQYSRQIEGPGTTWEDRGDWVLCPRERRPAGAYSASPIDLLRWADSLDPVHEGYDGLNATAWQALGAVTSSSEIWNALPPAFLPPNIAVRHNGWLFTTAHSELSDYDPELKVTYAVNSSYMDTFNLEADLWTLLSAQKSGLPAAPYDLYPQYIEPPCDAYFHGVPTEEFQACYDYWAALNRYPATLTTSPDSLHMSGAFKEIPGPLVKHVIPAAEYETITQSERLVGSAPVHVNFSRFDGELRATAIWQSTPGTFWTWAGRSPSVYEAYRSDYKNQGFLQTDLFVHQDEGPRLSATWKLLPHDGFESQYDMTDASFGAQHAAYTQTGLKLVHYIAYREGGLLKHAAIWQRVSGDYELTRSNSSAAYQAEFDARPDWDLHQIHAYDADSYAAIWFKPSPYSNVFSFENLADWTLYTGSIAPALDAVHTEGLHALRVSGSNFVEVRSSLITREALRARSGMTNPSFAASSRRSRAAASSASGSR